jgi:hypothetical protein
MVAQVAKTLWQKFEQQSKALQANVQKARDWFRTQAQTVRDAKPNEILKSDTSRLVQTPRLNTAHIGRMFLFFYDPKWKEELPYYDRFPLMIPIKFYKDGWLGLNLHYLPIPLRARLLDALYSTYQNKHLNERKKLELTYEYLKASAKHKYFKPCVKRYLNSHVRSKFFQVPPDQWDMMLTLPVERFEKASKQQVWKDSLKKLNMTRNKHRHIVNMPAKSTRKNTTRGKRR